MLKWKQNPFGGVMLYCLLYQNDDLGEPDLLVKLSTLERR